MSKKRSREDLRRMIAMGKEAQVIDWLFTHLDGQARDIRRQITIQSNRFQKLERKRLEGSIDRNSANVESSQISGILLEILDNYDFEGNAEKRDERKGKKVSDTQAQKPAHLASVGMLLLGIVLFSASGLLIWNLLGNQGQEGMEKGPELFYAAADWEGNWTVSFIHEGKIRKALVLLDEQKGNWMGRVEMLAEGGDAAYELILENIQFEKSFQWLRGDWRTEDNFIPALHGSCKLELKGGGKAFEGYFRNSDGSGQQNSWKGKKK